MNLREQKLKEPRDQTVNMPTGEYLVMALIIFGGLGVDMLIPMFVKSIVSDGVLYDKLISNFLTTIIWSTFLYWAFRELKSKGVTKLWNNLWTLKGLVITLGFATIIILISFILMGTYTPKCVQVLKVFYMKYGNFAMPTFIMQHIYYLFEASLMTMILILGQRWGEEKWPMLSKIVPVGGIVLCLTWGIIHMVTQDIAVGIYAMLISLLLGLGFTLTKKQLVAVYILSLVIFFI